MDADVVLQVVAIVLQFAHLRDKFFVGRGNQPLKKNVPTALVAPAEIRFKERLSQNVVAVHNHVVDFAERWFRVRDEFKAFAPKTEAGQDGVEITQLLAGIFNLLAQTVNKVFDQFLLGQGPLLGDALFILRQLGLDVAVALAQVAGGIFVFIIAKIVGETVAVFGLAQLIAQAGFARLVATFLGGGVIAQGFHRPPLPATLVFCLGVRQQFLGPGRYQEALGRLQGFGRLFLQTGQSFIGQGFQPVFQAAGRLDQFLLLPAQPADLGLPALDLSFQPGNRLGVEAGQFSL